MCELGGITYNWIDDPVLHLYSAWRVKFCSNLFHYPLHHWLVSWLKEKQSMCQGSINTGLIQAQFALVDIKVVSEQV